MISSHSMFRCLLIALVLVCAGSLPVGAAPATPVLSEAAEPLQFYVFSFTDTPAAEAAEDVVGGALAHELQVDPAVDGLVSFHADGWYTGEALLRDFGTALLDQDLALIRTGRGIYALVPGTNAPMLMARGGVVMRLAEPGSARPTVGPDDPTRVFVEAPPPWLEGAAAALALFFAGVMSGAAALFVGYLAWCRAQAEQVRIAAPVLRLTDQRPPLRAPVETARPDPDLVIPRFEDRR